MLPDALESAPSYTGDGTLGTGVVAHLDAIDLGAWEGPIRSSYGLHLVRVDARTPGRMPTLDEVRCAVEREWRNEQREEGRRRFRELLLEETDVIMEWPEPEEDPSS